MEDDILITIDDMRKTGRCVRGIKAWFEQNNLDFPAFLKDGIPASKLLATKDGYAEIVVDLVKAQRNG